MELRVGVDRRAASILAAAIVLIVLGGLAVAYNTAFDPTVWDGTPRVSPSPSDFGHTADEIYGLKEAFCMVGDTRPECRGTGGVGGAGVTCSVYSEQLVDSGEAVAGLPGTNWFHATVQCPADYPVVTGGGFEPKEGTQQLYSFTTPVSKPLDAGDAWYCKSIGTGGKLIPYCYAVCCAAGEGGGVSAAGGGDVLIDVVVIAKPETRGQMIEPAIPKPADAEYALLEMRGTFKGTDTSSESDEHAEFMSVYIDFVNKQTTGTHTFIGGKGDDAYVFNYNWVDQDFGINVARQGGWQGGDDQFNMSGYNNRLAVHPNFDATNDKIKIGNLTKDFSEQNFIVKYYKKGGGVAGLSLPISCPTGYVLKGINADGTPECVSGGGAGILPVGSCFNGQFLREIQFDGTSYNFICEYPIDESCGVNSAMTGISRGNLQCANLPGSESCFSNNSFFTGYSSATSSFTCGEVSQSGIYYNCPWGQFVTGLQGTSVSCGTP